MEIRNIAIIAHVDHGKTTLTDVLMRQCGSAEKKFVSMDVNALEQERGITIYSKNTSIFYPPSPKATDGQVKTTKINIVDTPGHADFSSEVERVLRSIDSVLLLVDAQEGPMPQTKFVLKKSLELGLKPIVVISKVDKPAARPEQAVEMVYELFLDLGANDEQLQFPVVYTVAKQGWAKKYLSDTSDNMNPLLDVILEHVEPASDEALNDQDLAAQSFNLSYDNYLGRMAVVRIYAGTLKAGQNVFIKNEQGIRRGQIGKIFTFYGTVRQEIAEAQAGDIVSVSGLTDIDIGETICVNEETALLPAIKIDEPTICLNFLVNNSPFAGRDGKYVTNRQLKERLEKELEMNVGLKIDFSLIDSYKVFGRGELHIAILLENMRREGYEMQISMPQVILKEENGQTLEPFEELQIDVPESYTGAIIEKLSKRKGQLKEIKPNLADTRLLFEIPTRGLLGYRNEFIVDTRGTGILCNHFIGFKPYAGDISTTDLGSMISMETGKALAYSLFTLQERGTLYIDPNTEVYEGMVIGNTAKGQDMAVNPIKGKHLTNMRASGSDENIKLTPPHLMTLERGMDIMKDDEYLEITPNHIRLRKKELTEEARVKAKRK
ncbi:MAG TPA: translational GTPase TypA [bacterium]|nr:translational GTPase TypA [bacterium]